VIVYRICQTYPPDHNPIDGLGAYQRGGRWNSKGVRAVYTASSLALARCELARHVNLESIPDGYRVYEIEVPDEPCFEIKELPKEWDDDFNQTETKNLGDNILNDPNYLSLKVPSVCDHNTYNFILNPKSKQYHKVSVKCSYPFKP